MRAWILAALVVSVVAAKGKNRHRAGGRGNNDSQLPPNEPGLTASNGFNVPWLQESPDPKYDPHSNDINHSSLRKALGSRFDPNFMSIHRPLTFKNSSVLDSDFPFRRNRHGRLVPKDPDKLPDYLRKVRFRYLWLPDGSQGLSSVKSDRLEYKLQNYLWAYTACPVVFKWRDVGRRFWPRWIKEGSCPKRKHSCSIPPGMHCQVAGTDYKTLLRWHCSHKYEKGCKWIKVEVPVVTRCECGCPKTD
ncbi:noggin-2-like [Neocloeon triangulifer]|uniref:noggin-2-like n=1 Tax=Neocloeon triangulifer TaxID=2078957 RepID=UPI00286F95FB|nr:noggin-2-like [Neocloeon triangulifer]XP_059478075.1 noggin-2-like [Neocloeon triangulifer]